MGRLLWTKTKSEAASKTLCCINNGISSEVCIALKLYLGSSVDLRISAASQNLWAFDDNFNSDGFSAANLSSSHFSAVARERHVGTGYCCRAPNKDSRYDFCNGKQFAYRHVCLQNTPPPPLKWFFTICFPLFKCHFLHTRQGTAPFPLIGPKAAENRGSMPALLDV